MTAELHVSVDQNAHSARVLEDLDEGTDHDLLKSLRADPSIEFLDHRAEQIASLEALRPQVDAELIAEPTRWAYYPWRRTVVGVLGPRAFRELRLNRNKNLITADEQDRLGTLRIGIAGLSVGHVIAHTLAAEGLCGELRLADFDHLELSNLNRVPATVLDLGVNKATVAARRIAEVDPYLQVEVLSTGVTRETMDRFLDGLDVVVEECDSLDMKALIREAARARRIPVLMATSDRGLVDVERFDLEPARPIMHGLLGDADSATLSGLSPRQKIPHMLGILDVSRSSARAAASMLEVGKTLTTWPQLMDEVALGASTVAVAIRRLALGEDLASGRVRIDIAERLDQLAEPQTSSTEQTAAQISASAEPAGAVAKVANAAILAPSGGNAQPWEITTDQESITVSLAPQYTSTLDIGLRSSAVAVGAAMFNARIAAAANNILGPVEFREDGGESPLRATMRFADGDDPELAELYMPMLTRETNRQLGSQTTVDPETIGLLSAAVTGQGARLHLLTSRDDIDTAARTLGAADRVRYLTPQLHSELISEVRWPGDPHPESGLDVRTLGLASTDLALLDILRRPDVMANLAGWDAGQALGDDTVERVRASSAVGVISVQGQTLTDYARGGSALEAMWISANQRGLAVHPVSPVFLYAHNSDELRAISPPFAPLLEGLQTTLRNLARTQANESPVLLFRLTDAPATPTRSRRRGIRLPLD